MHISKLNIDFSGFDLLPLAFFIHNGSDIYFRNQKFNSLFDSKKSNNLKNYFSNESLEKLFDLKKIKENEEAKINLFNKDKTVSFTTVSNKINVKGEKFIQTAIVTNDNVNNSHILLENISKASDDVIYYIDITQNNKLVFISEACEPLLGCLRKELYKDVQKLKTVIHKKDRASVILSKEDYFKVAGKEKGHQVRVQVQNSPDKFLEITTSPVYDNHKLVGLLGNIKDITQAQVTERLLIETKNKFDLITNNANDIIAFLTFEPKEKYLYVSPNIETILGYKTNELLNNPNFFEKKLVSGHEKFKHHTKILKTNQRENIKKNIHFSFNVLNKSNDNVWLENNLVPIVNSEGKIDFYINIIRDITEQKLAELEVENQYMNYRNLLDHSPAAYVIHHQGICLYLNKAFLDIIKYKNKGELLGTFIIDIFDESDRQRAINRIKEIYDTGSAGNKVSNYKVRDKQGNVVEVELTSGFIKFNNKDCVITLVDNVSKRRQIEKEKIKTQLTNISNIRLQKEINERLAVEKNLREKTAHLSAIFESSSHLIWSVNKNYELTSFNQNFYKLVKQNYNVRVRIGLKIDELIEKGREAYVNFWYPKYAQVFEGKKLEFEKEEIQDGVLFRRVFINPVYNSENVISEISCIANDITESKNYERKLLNQSGKLSAIFDSSHHYIWSIDREGKLTSFNRNYYDLVTSIYNTKPYLGLVLNRGVLSNDKEYNELLKFHYDKAFGGLATSFEIETRDKDLKNVHLEIFFNPIYQNDEVVEVSGIAHNITEKKLVQQKIELSLKEKEVLLKEVHHRVKNNMQVISSILNLQSSYVSDEYALTLLKESQNRIKTMAYIHESLYQNKSFTSVNFSEYVQTLINNIVQSYTHPSDKIKMKFNIEPLILSLDSSIPAGLIINELVTNAIKHAFPHPKSGTITFNLGYKNNLVILELKDNGVGFGPEVDFANSHSLGLQLVNTLIEQLDAKLKFKSRKGLGTEVSVSFKLSN